ncbi:GmrSD restriction endonuclease domain-containing protein [Cellulomonas composti]|uniref:GmrSD restriction endonuclease domain-containing protein n=1 Tax=Cellulomonas composti TaxID=266130 RepID=UPI001FE83D31|nr:DUF1524 domain-containing protein [Cellulomonas composti]
MLIPLVVALTFGTAGCSPGAETGAEPRATASPSATDGPGRTGESSATPVPTRPAATPSPLDAAAGTALEALGDLSVKGRAPRTGYDRALFGDAWADVDGNGCDTRNDVLARDLVDLTYESGSDCVVTSGLLHDPYTGHDVPFVRGIATSADVQIDHVVALSDSWQKGAQSWDAATREAFANDPGNLLAVDGPTNMSKGDGDAATWLPPNKAVRCAYVARQVAVKTAYGLWVTAAERDAIARVLATCPDEPLPAVVGPPAGSSPGSSGTTAPADPSTSPSTDAPAGVVEFANCAAAWAAGAAPLHRGDPGYAARLDRDGDSVACETPP